MPNPPSEHRLFGVDFRLEVAIKERRPRDRKSSRKVLGDRETVPNKRCQNGSAYLSIDR